MILSPNHSVAWRHATAPVTHASRTELWHTRLALMADDGTISELSATNAAPLRAIWSPDYNPGRAFDPSQHPTKTDPDPDLGVTNISPNDRHQIVILTSAFHGYADMQDAPFQPSPVDAQMLLLSPLGGWLRSRGHWEPPRALRFVPWPSHLFGLSAAGLERAPAVGGQPAAVTIPEAIAGAESGAPLTAAAGANSLLRRPVVARASIPSLTLGIPITGEQLDLSEWVHVAAQGRDHYVRIVYEGHLYPFGHRAALIKITERKFKDVPLPEGGTTPVAHMIQREYIVVREPEKLYRGQLTGNAEIIAGRKLPLTKLRLAPSSPPI